MDREAIDRLARIVGTRGGRRSAVGLALGAVAAALRADDAEAGAFPKRCSRFVLAGGDDRDALFRHVDDNLYIAVKPKKGGRERIVWDDRTDDQVNFEGEPFEIPAFRAEIGDKLIVQGYNREAGPCDLDEIWLFCENGGRGKRIVDRVGPRGSCNQGVFFSETVRIK